MRLKEKRKRVLGVFVVILVLGVIWVLWSNTALELSRYTLTSEMLPTSFDGFRIAQISDLHNAEFGKGNEKLLAMLRDAEPSIIVITGDMIDSRRTNIGIALEFAREAVKIAPCYYISGNHEARVREYEELKVGLSTLGVIVLEDAKVMIDRRGESFTLVGVSDPSFHTDYLFGDDETVMRGKLDELIDEADEFTVLLSHRPELFDIYEESSVDLILSGHAHGGQFRLPFVGGLVAPNQGLFPKYDGGMYGDGGTKMIVSRGVGNSIIPIRLNNRPEVVLVELRYEFQQDS